jgi:hypothetical protein
MKIKKNNKDYRFKKDNTRPIQLFFSDLKTFHAL